MIECQRCHAKSEDGKRFCSECGGPLDPAFAEMKQYLNFSMREELRSIIKSDYKDQHYLELTTTQAVVERITSWSKIFAGAVAIPLALLLFIFGAIGFKTYSDFTNELETVQGNVSAKLDAAQTLATKLQEDGTALSNEYEKLRAGLINSKTLTADVERLTAQYKELSANLEETAKLSDKVNRLNSRVTGIEDSIKSALLFGNSNYENLPKLMTPAHDAEDVGQAFTEIGYKVKTELNNGRNEMMASIEEFRKNISPGDTVVFYYSGHGFQYNGKNYIVPVDIMGDDLTPSTVATQAVDLDVIIHTLQQSNARAIVLIVDACRNDPFGVGKTRGISLKINPPPGVFILFSASDGEVAIDSLVSMNGGRNSLFAYALVPQIKRKNLSIEDLGATVSRQVAGLAKSVGVTQRPAYIDSAEGPIYLAGREK
ncbi:caspase family protein [Rhizobium ruizarguesonis]